MSIWEYLHNNLKQSEIEILHKNYEPPFIVEVREQCQGWIEENLINSNAHLDPDNTEHCTAIIELLQGLIVEIKGRTSQLRFKIGFVVTLIGASTRQQQQRRHGPAERLEQAVNFMKEEFSEPEKLLTLYRLIRRILNIENAFVQHCTTNMSANNTATPSPIPFLPDLALSPAGCSSSSFGSTSSSPSINSKPVVFPQITQKCIELKMESEELEQLFKCICEVRGQVLQGIGMPEEEEVQRADLTEFIQTLDELSQDGEMNEAGAGQVPGDMGIPQPAFQDNNKMLINFIQQFLNKIKKILADSLELVKLIKIEIASYNHSQESKLSSEELGILQCHCSTVAEIVISCCDLLKKLHTYFQSSILELPSLQSEFADLHAKLMRASFIIETQPCQIIKQDTPFNAKLRLMAGTANSSSDQVSIGHVTSSIVTKAEVTKLMRLDASSNFLKWVNSVNAPIPSHVNPQTLEIANENGEILVLDMAGTIDNNEEALLATNAFSVSFQKRIIRIPRNEGAVVSLFGVEYWILFHTEVTDILNNGLVQSRWLWALSSPLLIITSAAEEVQAFERIIWVNAMGPDILFDDNTPNPRDLPWENIVDALDKICLQMTKVSLTSEQKEYLKKRAFSVPLTNDYSPPGGYLTWDQFCITKFEDSSSSFTFSQWFYEIVKLIEGHLYGLWADGYIVGFISREDTAQKLLATRKPATCILRFSESFLGGIAITFLREDGTTMSIAPSTSNDLNQLSI